MLSPDNSAVHMEAMTSSRSTGYLNVIECLKGDICFGGTCHDMSLIESVKSALFSLRKDKT